MPLFAQESEDGSSLVICDLRTAILKTDANHSLHFDGYIYGAPEVPFFPLI